VGKASVSNLQASCCAFITSLPVIMAPACHDGPNDTGDVCACCWWLAGWLWCCSEALNLFSMEVADLLSARALEVSFASALSVVTPSGADDTQERVSDMLRAQLLDYAP